jgi:hypothetical protein
MKQHRCTECLKFEINKSEAFSSSLTIMYDLLLIQIPIIDMTVLKIILGSVQINSSGLNLGVDICSSYRKFIFQQTTEMSL